MNETQAFVEIPSRTAADLAQKYVALWNEPDADRRRRMITELWTEDGRHILQPPQEIRGIAARPGLAMTAILEARGYEEIDARAASAYEHWVGSEGLNFRGRDDAERLGDVVKFHWEAVARTTKCSESGSTSSSSPRTAGSSATTRSSSLRRDGRRFLRRVGSGCRRRPPRRRPHPATSPVRASRAISVARR
jgi:hypothetical protein